MGGGDSGLALGRVEERVSEHRESDRVLTVPAADAERLIGMLKRHLTGDRTCERCEYRAPVGQWGYRTKRVEGTDRVVVYACCPACESAVRIRAARTDRS